MTRENTLSRNMSARLLQARYLPLFILLSFGGALGQSGCAAVPTELAFPAASPAEISDEIEFEQEAALERLRSQDARVATIAFRLLSANTELCPKADWLTGMVMHSSSQFGPEVRPVAVRLYGLGDTPSIQVVAPGSPADIAGMLADDQLIAVNGKTFAAITPAQSSAGNYASIDAAWALITSEIRDGEALTFDIHRKGKALTLQLQPRLGCGYGFSLLTDDEFNAWADGKTAFVTTSITRYAQTEDELATIMAHELAHNILGHQDRISKSGPAGALLGNMGTQRSSLVALEKEADYLGLYLMARAGFDINKAGSFWRQFGADFPRSRYAGWSHPGSRERAINMISTAAEIERKRASGDPILPERRSN